VIDDGEDCRRRVADVDMALPPTPFTLVYRCWKSLKKTPLLATFGDVRRAFHAARLAP
jgi:hypothetical protein